MTTTYGECCGLAFMFENGQAPVCTQCGAPVATRNVDDDLTVAEVIDPIGSSPRVATGSIDDVRRMVKGWRRPGSQMQRHRKWREQQARAAGVDPYPGFVVIGVPKQRDVNGGPA